MPLHHNVRFEAPRLPNTATFFINYQIQVAELNFDEVIKISQFNYQKVEVILYD